MKNEANATITRIEHADGMTTYTARCPHGAALDFLIAAEKNLGASSGSDNGNVIEFTVFQDECAEKPGHFLTINGEFFEGEVTGSVDAMKFNTAPSQQAEMLKIWGEKYGGR